MWCVSDIVGNSISLDWSIVLLLLSMTCETIHWCKVSNVWRYLVVKVAMIVIVTTICKYMIDMQNDKIVE